VRHLALPGILLLACAVPAAVETRLGSASLQEAVGVGQSRLESVHTRFHAPYRIPVSQPPIDYIEVVTPYRRVVLAAEAQQKVGNRRFGQREALAALGDTPEAVDLVIEVTFHPFNTFVAVPGYAVQLLARTAKAAALVEPQTVERIPRFGPRLPGTPLPSAGPGEIDAAAASQPLVGGTLVARLDGGRLDPNGIYDVLVTEGRTAVAQTTIEFGRLR
jgi:hypothetical protein